MKANSVSTARVIADYQAPYPDPIVVKAGDEVSIDSGKKTDWAGWAWCTGRAGKSGWVPEAYIDRDGDVGHMRCDYDAIELTVHVGELLCCKASVSHVGIATNCARISAAPRATPACSPLRSSAGSYSHCPPSPCNSLARPCRAANKHLRAKLCSPPSRPARSKPEQK